MTFTRTFAALLAATAVTLSAGIASAQTLVVARGGDANSLDPAEGRSFEAIKVADWTFDGLVRFDGNSQKIVPALAESWTTAPDGLSWTFKLRPGVKFHDGTPVNADAVVFSLERQRDKAHPYHCKACRRWGAKFGPVTKTEKIDDMTVKISLEAPFPVLLVNAAFYVGYIVSPTAVMKDPEGFRKNPVGTGPFKFVRWERDNVIELVRNDDYYLGKPKVERLVVRVIPDNDVRLLALKKGEVHVAYGMPFAQFPSIDKDPALNLYQSGTLGISMMQINVEKKPFDNVKVRRAIQHAINRDRIFKTAFYSLGMPADQLIPPTWWGHSKNATKYEYDVDKAKALMKEAGVSGTITAELLSFSAPRPYLPSPSDSIALIKTDLAKIGIDVKIKQMKFSAYRSARTKGEFDFAMGGWVSGTLDPDGMQYPLYHSGGIKRGANWSRWVNAESDALLEKARGMYDQAKREPLYQKSGELIADAAISVFLAHPITAIAARKEVQNIFIHASNWVPLHDVSIAK